MHVKRYTPLDQEREWVQQCPCAAQAKFNNLLFTNIATRLHRRSDPHAHARAVGSISTCRSPLPGVPLLHFSRTQGTNCKTDAGTVAVALQHQFTSSSAFEYDEGGLGVRRCCGA